MKLRKHQIEKALSKKIFDLGNSILYDLCERYPNHERDDVIIAKIMTIGRTYAAAIERRNTKDNLTSDAFLFKCVVPKIRSSSIDKWLDGLRHVSTGKNVVRVHKQVTDLFSKISGMEKRSLASKYLHFHFPHLYYLYDSRAKKALTALTKSDRNGLSAFGNCDEEYARLFLRCEALNDEVEALIGRRLSPRELDTVLLDTVREN